MPRIGFIEPIEPAHLDRSRRQHTDPKGTKRKLDQHSPGQRDRDRVLYASSFRRLAGVTQVVLAADEGHVRSWASTLIGRFVTLTSFDASGLTRGPEIFRDIAFLKQLTRQYVFRSPLLKTHQHGQKEIFR